MQHLRVFLLLFFLGVSMSSNAQSVLGQWLSKEYGLELVITQEGNYQLVNTNLNAGEQGVYTHNENMLFFQNQAGEWFQYKITQLDAESMHLQDAASALIYPFERVGTQPDFGGEEIAEKNGYILKEGHRDVYVALIEFLTYGRASNREKESIKTECTNSFLENPEQFMTEVSTLMQSLTAVFRTQDLTQIGMARLNMLSVLHQNKELNTKSAFMLAIESHCSLAAYDANTRIPLTWLDLKGIVSYIEFINVELAEEKAFTKEEKNLLEKQIMNGFATMSTDQKQAIAMGGLLNLMVQQNWKKLSDEQKQQFRQQLKNNNTYNQQDWNNQEVVHNDWKPNPRIEELKKKASNGKLSSAEMAEYKAHLRTQNMYFNVMNDMMLNQHATSLNIIENMGGTNNYWEVVPNTY